MHFPVLLTIGFGHRNKVFRLAGSINLWGRIDLEITEFLACYILVIDEGTLVCRTHQTLGKTPKKEKGGFFKNLFRKKPKNDSTSVNAPPASVEGASATDQPRKKGGLFRKKPAEAKPKKKEEGDGF